MTTATISGSKPTSLSQVQPVLTSGYYSMRRGTHFKYVVFRYTNTSGESISVLRLGEKGKPHDLIKFATDDELSLIPNLNKRPNIVEPGAIRYKESGSILVQSYNDGDSVAVCLLKKVFPHISITEVGNADEDVLRRSSISIDSSRLVQLIRGHQPVTESDATIDKKKAELASQLMDSEAIQAADALTSQEPNEKTNMITLIRALVRQSVNHLDSRYLQNMLPHVSEETQWVFQGISSGIDFVRRKEEAQTQLNIR